MKELIIDCFEAMLLTVVLNLSSDAMRGEQDFVIQFVSVEVVLCRPT